MKKNFLRHFNAIAMCGVLMTTSLSASAPADHWEGPYAGITLGYSSLGGDFFDLDPNYLGNGDFDRAHGLVLGGQTGYNWLSDSWLYGVEADVMANMGENADSYTTAGFPGPVFTGDMDGLGSVRLRVGMVDEDSLYYVTGGIAVAAVEHKHYDSSLRGSTNQFYLGWTVGAGWEYVISKIANFRVEGRYSGFEKKTWTDQSNENFGMKPNLFTLAFGVNFNLN